MTSCPGAFRTVTCLTSKTLRMTLPSSSICSLVSRVCRWSPAAGVRGADGSPRVLCDEDACGVERDGEELASVEQDRCGLLVGSVIEVKAHILFLDGVVEDGMYAVVRRGRGLTTSCSSEWMWKLCGPELGNSVIGPAMDGPSLSQGSDLGTKGIGKTAGSTCWVTMLF